ncbi:hypothetical protein [Marinibactrum halimedae]|uniref:Uncharacterized protein n=1 Tax=Marinibactrum halimedae TaxID=1444977 RepID=A0AA37WMT5_9GAMM|nr:hypothetical protein [Marinibactrum halimedae]MCD9460739.1 hypothetical protein [Marinibactrum halimedae]GLS26688.1 hypothetical protein GCM10007877_24050 [Marinibactrum halimedae]
MTAERTTLADKVFAATDKGEASYLAWVDSNSFSRGIKKSALDGLIS